MPETASAAETSRTSGGQQSKAVEHLASVDGERAVDLDEAVGAMGEPDVLPLEREAGRFGTHDNDSLAIRDLVGNEAQEDVLVVGGAAERVDEGMPIAHPGDEGVMPIDEHDGRLDIGRTAINRASCEDHDEPPSFVRRLRGRAAAKTGRTARFVGPWGVSCRRARDGASQRTRRPGPAARG